MFWGFISYYGVSTLSPVVGNLNSEKYGCFLYPSKVNRLRTVLEEIVVTNWRLNWSVISPKLCLLIEIGNNRKVYAWRKVDERLRPECNGLYHGRNYKTKLSVMFWGCISYYGVGTLTPVVGNLNSEKYINIFPMISHCPHQF
jgi:hypothetical protein